MQHAVAVSMLCSVLPGMVEIYRVQQKVAHKDFAEFSETARNFNTIFYTFIQHIYLYIYAPNKFSTIAKLTEFLLLPPSDFHAFKNVCTEELCKNVETMSTKLLLITS